MKTEVEHCRVFFIIKIILPFSDFRKKKKTNWMEVQKRKWRRISKISTDISLINSLDDGCLMHIFSFLSPIPGIKQIPLSFPLLLKHVSSFSWIYCYFGSKFANPSSYFSSFQGYERSILFFVFLGFSVLFVFIILIDNSLHCSHHSWFTKPNSIRSCKNWIFLCIEAWWTSSLLILSLVGSLFA